MVQLKGVNLHRCFSEQLHVGDTVDFNTHRNTTLEVRSEAEQSTLMLHAGGSADSSIKLKIHGGSELTIRNVNYYSPDREYQEQPTLVINDAHADIVTLDTRGNLWVSGSAEVGDYDSIAAARYDRLRLDDPDLPALMHPDTIVRLQSSGATDLHARAGMSSDATITITSGPNQVSFSLFLRSLALSLCVSLCLFVHLSLTLCVCPAVLLRQDATLKLVDPADSTSSATFLISNRGGAANATLAITDGDSDLIEIIDQGDVGAARFHGDLMLSATGLQARTLSVPTPCNISVKTAETSAIKVVSAFKQALRTGRPPSLTLTLYTNIARSRYSQRKRRRCSFKPTWTTRQSR